MRSSMRSQRLIAAISLVLVALTELAPHRHHDPLFEIAGISSGELHSADCVEPNAKVAHLHKDVVRQIDLCVACMRQHMPATLWNATGAAPEAASRPLASAARLARVHIRISSKSSRAPPCRLS
jgi:hypothetical protein